MATSPGPGEQTRPSFHSITPVRAYEGIVEQVEQAVFSGALLPGDRLPSERELMAQFSVSRSTVREALRVLDSHGIVRSRPGDKLGPEIQAHSAGRLTKALSTFARLGQISVAQVVEFRMVVEGSAVRLAAELHDDDQLAAMRAALASMERAAGESSEAFSEADVEFHLAVARCSGNSLISACGEFAHDLVLQMTTNHVRSAADPAELFQETLRRHGAYLDAIATRDGRRAEALARQDLVDYYGPQVSEAEQSRLRLLLLDNP